MKRARSKAAAAVFFCGGGVLKTPKRGDASVRSYWRREFVEGLLRLGRRQSYRLFAPTESGRISSEAVVRRLNAGRVGVAAPLTEAPSDLMRPEEAAEMLGVDPSELRRWSRRRVRPAPHFRLTGHTLRYPARALEEWMTSPSHRGKGAA